jgi:hypothetical protein
MELIIAAFVYPIQYRKQNTTDANSKAGYIDGGKNNIFPDIPECQL